MCKYYEAAINLIKLKKTMTPESSIDVCNELKKISSILQDTNEAAIPKKSIVPSIYDRVISYSGSDVIIFTDTNNTIIREIQSIQYTNLEAPSTWIAGSKSNTNPASEFVIVIERALFNNFVELNELNKHNLTVQFINELGVGIYYTIDCIEYLYTIGNVDIDTVSLSEILIFKANNVSNFTKGHSQAYNKYCDDCKEKNNA